MKKRPNWPKIIHLSGVVALLLGILDPMEGSIAIAAGAFPLTIGSYLLHDRFFKWFLFSSILIWIGVAALFWISSLGGFLGDTGRSWWWGLFILPYPVGWLMAVVVLIVKAVRKSRLPAEK